GMIQLLAPDSSTPYIADQRGFPRWWIEYWSSTAPNDGAGETALARGERVVVEDVEDVEDSWFFSRKTLEMYHKVGIRALQSTPLVTRSGTVIGILSTYFKERCRLDASSLLSLDLLARETTEIIQHTHAQENLRRQAPLLDLAHDAMFVRDHEGHITYWNEGATRCYGWSRDEALGRMSNILLQTQFPESLERVLDIVQRAGHWDGELVQTCRDGRRIIVASRWA